MCDVLESAGYCSNDTLVNLSANYDYEYEGGYDDELISPSWPQGICVATNASSSADTSFSCVCPSDSWFTGRSDIINFDGYLCHNPRILEQVIWAIACAGAIRVIYFGIIAWRHQHVQAIKRDAIKSVSSRRAGVYSGVSQTTTRQQVAWLSWICCCWRRRQPLRDSAKFGPFEAESRPRQYHGIFRHLKLCCRHAPLRYVTASTTGFVCIAVSAGMKAATDHLICVDLILTIFFAFGWATSMIASVPVNNNLYAMMAKGDMVAENIERVHRLIKTYQVSEVSLVYIHVELWHWVYMRS
jgi:hypothetical protein